MPVNSILLTLSIYFFIGAIVVLLSKKYLNEFWQYMDNQSMYSRIIPEWIRTIIYLLMWEFIAYDMIKKATRRDNEKIQRNNRTSKSD